MIKQLKALRAAIDRDMQHVVVILNITGSGLQNVNNAWISLRLARAWLGKVFRYVDDLLDKDEWSEYLLLPADNTGESMIRSINKIRNEIGAHMAALEKIPDQLLPHTYRNTHTGRGGVVICINEAWKHLSEADFHLGFQIEILRDLIQEPKQKHGE